MAQFKKWIEDNKLDESQYQTFEDTPSVILVDNLENCKMKEEESKEPKDWLPLISYDNGAREGILYRNIKTKSKEYGKFKTLTTFMSGDVDILERTAEEGMELYKNWIKKKLDK